MKHIFKIIVLSALLSGCAANSVKGLKSNSKNTISIELSENYQRVYKNVLEKMRECKGEGWAGAFAQYHIRNSLYSDLGEAEISYVMSNLGHQGHYLHVEINAVGDSKTELNIFAKFKSDLYRIEMWATDIDATCNVKPPK